MTGEPLLFSLPKPPPVAGIDLRLGCVRDAIAEADAPVLVHADPPWTYQNAGTRGNAADQYDLQGMDEIVEIVGSSAKVAAPKGARLVLWTTWPMLGQWMEATRGWPWGAPVTGGSWHKEGSPGVGFHWLGNSEPVLVYRVGRPPTARSETITNAHASRRERHSEKPSAWLRGMVRRWTAPGDQVLDLYAGMAPMARACAAEGRRYIGAEIGEERHAEAVGTLARHAWRLRGEG